MSHQDHERSASGLIVRFAVLTLSDTRTPETDTSGQAGSELILAGGHSVTARLIIADEPGVLSATLERWLADPAIDAIITTGGTGISTRDQTIPVVESILDATLPGFGEIFRTLSFRDIGPAAMLSRAVGGIARRKLLIALPGSTPAVTLALRELILPQAPHIISLLRK